jgi:hypothetical protein
VRAASRGGTDFSRYADDWLGFASEVLHVTLWAKQCDILLGIMAHPRFVHYGCNGGGKTYIDAVAMLCAVYTRGALCIALSPKEDQLRGQLMRDVARIWHGAPALGGQLRAMGLQLPAEPDRGILCIAAGATDRARGYHAPLLCVFLQESQGLDEWVFQTAGQMSVGAHDKICASGNCDRGPVGEFYKISKLWPSIGMSAYDHPNLTHGKAIIPGGPSTEGVALLAAQYGVDSPFFIAAVLGEFPKDAQHSLFLAEWIDDAVQLFNRGSLHHTMSRRLRFGIDVARFGADKTVVCVLQGQVVTDFVAWGGVPLDQTVARIIEVVSRFGVRPVEPVNDAAEAALYYAGMDRLVDAQPGDPLDRQPHARRAVLRVDTVGVGGGPHDELKARRYPVEAFVAGERPTGERADRYFNRRAQAYWELREALERGELALPPAHRDQLVRELTAISYAPNADRKIQIESKAAIKVKLSGASPDYADALTMAHCSDGVLDFTTALSERGEAVTF